MNFLNKAKHYHNQLFDLVSSTSSAGLLIARLYISWVFFKAGLTKIQNWESTLFLFEYEYQVPMLSYELAAYLATTAELLLPILLTVGLLTRISAIGLTVVNIVAVIAYMDISMAALNMHIVWGVVLLANILFGAGFFSIDRKLKLT